MTDHERWMRWALVPALAAALAACGGGATDTSTQRAPPVPESNAAATPVPAPAPAPAPDPAPVPAPAPVPVTSTMPDYLFARAQVVTVMGFAAPLPAELASIFADSRDHAVDVLRRQLIGYQSNAMVVPPLRYAFLDTVASAARGDTLAELQRHYPSTLGWYAAASQTQGIDRQVWAQRGARFLPAFLGATDSFGPYPPLGSWAGAEIGEGWLDNDLRQALGTLHPDLPAAVPVVDANTRLLVADALRDSVIWPEAKVFDGVFETIYGVRLVMPMLRLSAGVKRQRGADFEADAVRLGDRWLLTIRPNNGSPKEFVDQGRLAAAIGEAVQALTTAILVAVPDGEIVLPVLSTAFSGNAISSTWLGLAYDEINADLRGLDGGGTFLKAADVNTRLTIGASGLSSQAAQVSTFHFSPKNRFVPDGTYNGNFTSYDPPSWVQPPACPHSTPDLRSFFLVVLDEQKRVMSLAAIAALNGSECQ